MIVCSIGEHCALCEEACPYAEIYKPVIKAKWIKYALGQHYCSHCKAVTKNDNHQHYCPNCGAEMREI